MKHSLLLGLVGFSTLTVQGQHLVLDPTFNAGSGFTAAGVEALAVQADGRILYPPILSPPDSEQLSMEF